MSEHASLTVKVEEESGGVTYLGAVSVQLLANQSNLDRRIAAEMESGERRYVDRGLVWILNAQGKTIDRIDLRHGIGETAK